MTIEILAGMSEIPEATSGAKNSISATPQPGSKSSFTAALRFPFFFRVKTVPGRIRHVGGGCDEHELLLQDPHRVGRALLLRPLQEGLA